MAVSKERSQRQQSIRQFIEEWNKARRQFIDIVIK